VTAVIPFDYAGSRDDADALLAEFGTASALRRLVNSGTAWEPTQTSTDYPTVAVRLNLRRWYPAFEDNSDILRTDRLGLLSMGPLAALGVTEVLPFDTLVFGGTWNAVHSVQVGGIVYRIIDAKPIAPSGLAVVYSLQLRI
jgi:hypothetical protein